MVAITGCVLHNADVEFPGYLSLSQQLKFSDIPNGGQGIFNIPAAGVAQILLFCGLVEMAWWPASKYDGCLLYTSPSPRDAHESRMPSSA